MARGFGQGKGPVHLDQVRCTGKEEFLGECPSLGLNMLGCRHGQVAGVKCDTSAASTSYPMVQVRHLEASCGVRKLQEDGGESKAREGGGNMLRWVVFH